MRFLMICVCCFWWGMIYAQPQLSSLQVLEGVNVYRDYKKDNTFYYAPGKLQLAVKTDGEPIFKLIQLRYTGTFATGDQGSTRFMNIVQFTVKMALAERTQLQAIKKSLGLRADLRPLPIRNVEAYMVAPFGGKYKKIGSSGSLEGDGKSGSSNSSSYWTERTFTLRLENHEAELLWNMVQEGQLAISVNYAFFADVLNDQASDFTLKGKSEFVEGLGEQLEDLMQADTMPSLQVINADAFPIAFDALKYAHLLVREDIDAGIPPAYPALEVRCYDFSDGLRPDLSIKAIELEATGVNGYPIKLKPFKFVRSKPDLNAFQIRFPYAVKMDKPFRYRVKSYDTAGGVSPYTEWISRDSWAGRIDITTTAAENNLNRRLLELETDLGQFGDRQVELLEIKLIYRFSEQLREMDIHFREHQPLPLQQLRLVHDKNTPVYGLPIWTFKDGTQKEGEMQELSIDNYMFFLTPEK